MEAFKSQLLVILVVAVTILLVAAVYKTVLRKMNEDSELEYVPEDVIEGNPSEASADIPADASEDIPVDESEDIPEGSPDDAHKETPEEKPDVVNKPNQPRVITIRPRGTLPEEYKEKGADNND